MGCFYKGKGKKRRMVIRPSRILSHILKLSREGIPLRSDNILASFEWAKNNPRIKGKGRSQYKKVLVGSAVDPKIVRERKRARTRSVKKIEGEISVLSKQISKLRNTVGKSYSEISIDSDQAKELESKRALLITERNNLL